MKLSEEEITKHLLESANSLGKVEGLVAQILEHYKSFNADRKRENDETRDSIKELSKKLEESQKESRQETKQLVIGMNSKMDKSEQVCDGRVGGLSQRIDYLEKGKARQAGFIGGISLAVSSFIALVQWVFSK